MIIDFSKVNQEDFQLKRRDGRVLITPRPTKHRWTAEDRHLRSLLCDEQGRVLSAGFPKFHNWGESADMDAALEAAIGTANIQITDKRDGSLLIATAINGKPHFRTRGNFDLGEFREKVEACIEKYPGLIELLTDARGGHMAASILMEYTAPDNQIVLAYPEAELRVLAVVWHDDLRVDCSYGLLKTIEGITGVPLVDFESHRLLGAQHFADLVKTWKGREGVVLRWLAGSGSFHLLKMKAEEYCLAHSLKFGMNERKVARLAFLLNLQPGCDLAAALHRFKVDAEAVEIVRPWFDAYFARLQSAREWFINLLDYVDTVRDRYQDDRKGFVAWLKAIVADHQLPDTAFHVGIRAFDCRWDDTELLLHAYVLDESGKSVQNWLANRDATINDLLKVQDTE